MLVGLSFGLSACFSLPPFVYGSTEQGTPRLAGEFVYGGCHPQKRSAQQGENGSDHLFQQTGQGYLDLEGQAANGLRIDKETARHTPDSGSARLAVVGVVAEQDPSDRRRKRQQKVTKKENDPKERGASLFPLQARQDPQGTEQVAESA